MAESKSEMDAHEPATAHKLDKAHEQGRIFRSGELTFAVVLVVCVGCVYGLGARVLDGTGLQRVTRPEADRGDAFHPLTR